MYFQHPSRVILSAFFAVTLTACDSNRDKTDTTPPTQPSGTSINSTSNGLLTVSGNAEANSTIEVTFPNGSKKTVTVSSGGTYSVTSDQPQSSGSISIISTDSDGNTSQASTAAFVDSVAPSTPTNTNISTTDNGIVTASGSAEVNSIIEVTFPDGSKKTVTTSSSGAYSVTSDLPQPNGSVSVISTDSAGNASQPTSVAFTDSFIPDAPTDTVLSASNAGLVTVAGSAEAQSNVKVTFPDGSEKTIVVSSDGSYSVTSDQVQPSGTISIVSTDNAGNTSLATLQAFTADLESATVLKALYKLTGTMPELPFKPSLGINTEAAQGGADTVGMPMPFVDIFRTARPFAELSPVGTTIDSDGWPTQFAADSNFARTKLLQGTMGDSMPEGVYTVLYDGSGTLEMGSIGAVNTFTNILGENKYTFELYLTTYDPEDEVAAADTNSINLNIRGAANGDTTTLKNIRVVMPGGTCDGNPFLHMDSQADCPDGVTFESFADRLANDRNAIIFNPDYLLFLRNFKVVRMMNLMEASLKDICPSADGTACPADIGEWSHLAQMDDAVWGGNDQRTPAEKHKGVPIEVMVALANTLKRDIWVNMPHVATDDYVTEYAKYVYENLDSSLQVYVEYSNEVWNPGFAAHDYTTAKGIDAGLDSVPAAFATNTNRDANYFARLRYYSTRSKEIFALWKTEFGGAGDTRVQRILGSFIGDRVLTEQMLLNLTTDSSLATDHVDAVAIAPYFYGCPYASACPNAAKNLLDATTVDDIFDILNQPNPDDVKALDGVINSVKNQLTATNAHNLKLVTYEGGQHLVTGVMGGNISDADKPAKRKLFNDANRDPRMKERYMTFLDGWKDLADDGTTLFTLYTMPQSFYRFGNFGIKEHLNQLRSEAPKYDGIMTFQETHGDCWWDNCNP